MKVQKKWGGGGKVGGSGAQNPLSNESEKEKEKFSHVHRKQPLPLVHARVEKESN